VGAGRLDEPQRDHVHAHAVRRQALANPLLYVLSAAFAAVYDKVEFENGM
jgi:hypothetical protein